jgi:hypothetical protein
LFASIEHLLLVPTAYLVTTQFLRATSNPFIGGLPRESDEKERQIHVHEFYLKVASGPHNPS